MKGDGKMKPLTVKDLYERCKQEIKKGHGDHVIMLSDDDEGNGYHYCWYSFTTAEELAESDPMICDFIVDEDIATIEQTIILG